MTIQISCHSEQKRRISISHPELSKGHPEFVSGSDSFVIPVKTGVQIRHKILTSVGMIILFQLNYVQSLR
ncbi:MAG: hypothetical protein OQK52_00210 [Ignavibacteriaceae bacterium]|nr:hypothetical protein [Chlorobium sp.]MCW8816276.1 hypothetical protein [Ignavibacteriaceae bacterium]